MAWEEIPDAPMENFNVFLHELRTRELRKMPPGGKTVLSGGAAGGWYFDWMRECYPSLTKHIGVEAYQSKPDDLPPEAVWISNYLGNMHDVKNGEADLVFAGQTVEHMWPDDLANFLCESHRVLSDGGVLVMDSPNRRVTKWYHWHHPQHTAEFNVEEIVEITKAAGFDIIDVRGVWLCYGAEDHCLLPYEATVPFPSWPWKRRVALSASRPEDCFSWWLEARKSNRQPNRELVSKLTQAVYDEAFAAAQTREFVRDGIHPEGGGQNRLFRVEANAPGYVLFGPYVPLRPGKHRVIFRIGKAHSAADLPANTPACVLDMANEGGAKVHGSRTVTVGEIPKGDFAEFALDFELTETAFGSEFRLFTHGAVPLVIRTLRQVVEVEQDARYFAN
ncbi:methyltransferase domain-containing protein [Tuwongella immobilis]|uniref:Methyltransferase type 11 domain-containing protein n=1 Tax=Tuwongella immobilis TaxID=692036 RepID=A0A6C2YLY1_9BACT|nr:methyltransferase domain-containing protein [Tuwongella immobilis]VIP02133.1 Methyltransferase type 11 OS=Brevundimonas subvibrioides (strain ATCC 15264 / DSM 4735 / LMG 14903 / NBRC 16000 / CB 81) GN=Bresu_3289 PE=4 SV=1: Methyltransf_23 [Tuwongella immobilis]VTS00485.1 Methyltransferase type 11 OS=Brevundimonas subvibrioides (strain ATCC 15264 / DSM 4735 / LMG 14903 / NBRC 16000 / CB 81) GN=Bresu_3289 PE=4 SV=1: Methyltransf_23 [Tuwongella immobilis]